MTICLQGKREKVSVCAREKKREGEVEKGQSEIKKIDNL